MKWFDFLFWHYYCYIEQKKTVKEDGSWLAIIWLTFTTLLTLGVVLSTIDTFVMDLHLPTEYEGEKGLGWIIGIPWLFYLYFRYKKKKSIIQNKYQRFRECWGDPMHMNKRNMRILLIYTLVTTIGMLLYATIMGELNKRGLLDGCRLFHLYVNRDSQQAFLGKIVIFRLY